MKKSQFQSYKTKSLQTCLKKLPSLENWWFATLIKNKQTLKLRPASLDDLHRDVSGISSLDEPKNFLVDKRGYVIHSSLVIKQNLG